MSAQTPPTGTGVGKTSPGRRALPCLTPIPATHQLCVLAPKHRGAHLPSARWAQVDISDSNPKWSAA